MGNVIAALCDKITFQKVQPDISPVLSFPGLEIKQHQRRVLRDGNEVPLTRNEYGVLAYLATYPEHVFSKCDSFFDMLSVNARLFEVVRYKHEYSTIVFHDGYIHFLAKALKGVCEELNIDRE